MAVEPIKKRPRGRPRGHSGAAERERKILDVLHTRGPLTRNDIAGALGEENLSLVYLALSRMRERGQVLKTAAETGPETLWQIKGNALPDDWTHG